MMDSTTKKLLIAGAVSVVAGALIGYVAGRRRRQNSNLLAALDEIKARALTSLQVDLATIFDQVGLNGGCGWLSWIVAVHIPHQCVKGVLCGCVAQSTVAGGHKR